MDVKIQSVKFDADQKLIDFINKKVDKFPRFFEKIIGVDITLSLLSDPANKNVKIRVSVPGDELLAERNAKSFETALNECVDILKDKLSKKKEMMLDQ